MTGTLAAHLTEPRGQDFERLRRQTHDGQAHWAGSGPDDKTCRECAHWMNGGDWYAQSSKHGPVLKPSPCRRFKELTNRKGKGVPHSAKACRHFEPLEKPLAIKAKQ